MHWNVAQKTRQIVATWLIIMLAMVLFGCSKKGVGIQTEMPEQETTSAAVLSLAAADTTPSLPVLPPVVPVGLDTAFVMAADNEFGIVMDSDELVELATEARQLDMEVQVTDTLGAVARFVQFVTTGEDRFMMSAADSQVVGHLLLRGMAATDPGARNVLGLKGALQELDLLVQRSDSLRTDLEWGSVDPTRLAQSREIKVAVLGFADQSFNLHTKLSSLLGGLTTSTMAADSAQTQQEIGQLVRRFGSELDQVINEMGRAAQNVTAGSLSAESLLALKENLKGRRQSLLGFTAQWIQFEETGSLGLANPQDGYNSGRMHSLLSQMEKDLMYLGNLAGQRAAAIANASEFQTELSARREAEEFVRRTQASLMDLKKRNRHLVAAYGRSASRYWQSRLNQVAGAKGEREDLYAQLESMVAESGSMTAIRDDASLLVAYRETSNRLLALRRSQLARVESHDGLRESVRASLAADLYSRARVLGNPIDYEVALETYGQLAVEQPGEFSWLYQMANLAWARSGESWAWNDSLNTGQKSRAQAVALLDDCENVLIQRFGFDRDMAETKSVLKGETQESQNQFTEGAAETPVARAAHFIPNDQRWYYGRFVGQARNDLRTLGDAAVDVDVRRWLLNIDILRKRLAFDAQNGDEFLYRYARQAMLSDSLDPAAARQVLEHWSWDNGNLALKQRWSQVNLLPDSTLTLATVKRDSLVTLAANASTAGVRRQIDWTIGNVEFLKLAEHDMGLERMHGLLKSVDRFANQNPEVGAIDSTIVAVYPVFLYNRGTFYQQEGQRQEAFYCFLGVAEQYAWDLRTAAMARYSAAALLADGNKRGALRLVRTAIQDALRVVGENPADFDLETLVAMYELRQNLAGELGLFQEAVSARDEARQIRGLADRASISPATGSTGEAQLDPAAGNGEVSQ